VKAAQEILLSPVQTEKRRWKTMEIINLDPEKVKDNPYQPRKGYSQKKIEEIASSIEQNGLLETPVGRRRNGDVEIAFGHLRKRAFIKLKKRKPKKWPTMPVEIREISDRDMAVFALEENLKRADITPIDLARSVTRYFEVFTEATETELASKLSMTQGNVSNMRRVMRLPDEVLQKIDDGRISFTMARELLIFEGLSGKGKESRYSRKEGGYKDIPKDSKWLMLDAVKSIVTPGTEGRYGTYPATVEGMQKAIHDTVKDNFKPLGTGGLYGAYRSEELLFNVEKAGCKTCGSVIKTHPMKSQACSWCTKPKCWEKKQEAHKEKAAAEAKKKMEEDILRRAAEAEKERQAKTTISQEIPVELQTYRIYHRDTNKFWDGQAESPQAACTKAGWPMDDCWVRVRTPIVKDPSTESGTRGGGWANVTPREAPKDIVDSIPEEEREHARERIKQLKKNWPQYPCLTCLSVGRCDGTGVYAVSGVGAIEVFACDDHMGKGDVKKIREKATLKVPPELMDLAKEKAGSRAEVLDLNELRIGSYGDLKQGYVLLDSTLNLMDKPLECLETCIKGFHYAFDSRPRPSWDTERENKVSYVCTDPKCVSQKKAAHTRAVNAAGQAKKKAEVTAIKQALDKTTSLDKIRMKVIIAGIIHTTSSYSYRDDPSDWFLARLKIDGKEVKGTDYGAAATAKVRAAIPQKIDALSEAELAQLLLEFYLVRMMYQGDIKDYKVQTTEALNWLGIGINIEKEKGEEG
jgi:ParB/RepB/Spo0J family partition protein